MPAALSSWPVQRYHVLHRVGVVLLAVDGPAEGVDDDEGRPRGRRAMSTTALPPSTRVERCQRRQRGVVQSFECAGVVVAHVLEPVDDVPHRHLVVEVQHLDGCHRAEQGSPGGQPGGQPQGEQRLAGATLGEDGDGAAGGQQRLGQPAGRVVVEAVGLVPIDERGRWLPRGVRVVRARPGGLEHGQQLLIGQGCHGRTFRSARSASSCVTSPASTARRNRATHATHRVGPPRLSSGAVPDGLVVVARARRSGGDRSRCATRAGRAASRGCRPGAVGRPCRTIRTRRRPARPNSPGIPRRGAG